MNFKKSDNGDQERYKEYDTHGTRKIFGTRVFSKLKTLSIE